MDRHKNKTFCQDSRNGVLVFLLCSFQGAAVADWCLAIQSVCSIGWIGRPLSQALRRSQSGSDNTSRTSNAPEAFHRAIVNTASYSRLLCVIFCLSSLVLNCWLVYWNPRSLWNSGCASGYFWVAKSKVSNYEGSLVTPNHCGDVLKIAISLILKFYKTPLYANQFR